MAQEAAGWLQSEEEGKRKAAQEAAEKAQEAAKEAEEAPKEAEEAARKAAEEAKRKLDEELKKQEAERPKLTEIGQSTAEGQTQETENLEVQDPQVPAASTLVVPTLKLVPFVQERGKEIPDFNTVYYDKETKRIMKRTERRVEAKSMPGKMITDTTVMLGIDQDPRFTLRAGAAMIDASEDNINRVMTELDSSKKSSAQLKDTLRK